MPKTQKPVPKAVKDYLANMARQGGIAKNAKMTPEQRSAHAKKMRQIQLDRKEQAKREAEEA